jgi:hypothetical protein
MTEVIDLTMEDEPMEEEFVWNPDDVYGPNVEYVFHDQPEDLYGEWHLQQYEVNGGWLSQQFVDSTLCGAPCLPPQ